MNKLSILRLIQFAVITAFAISCGGGEPQEGEELVTDTGITYEFVNKGSGELNVLECGPGWANDDELYE